MTEPGPFQIFPQKRERSTSASHGGFTLIELIIFIVVVSAGLAGILSVMNTTVKSSADPLVRKQSIAIAESMLEEILLKDYCDPDTIDVTLHACGALEKEATRNLYDDVDDYAGYTTVAGIVYPTDPSNTVMGLENYNISAVNVVKPGDGSAAATAYASENPALYALGAKKVTVSVTSLQGTLSLTGYRANY
jgi:MSHA pilin protein MshD